jgi:hypothetical protein
MSEQYDLRDSQAYQIWKARKLAAYPLALPDCMTIIKSAEHPSIMEIQQLKRQCQHFNFALYRFASGNGRSKQVVHHLSALVGLNDLNNNLCADSDGLTSLQVTHHAGQHDYIPYTTKPLSWHTDGYYNPPHEQINGMLLHCAQPALEGGSSWFMDHEIAYILLRDANPNFIQALMHPAAFTIPANILNGQVIRPTQTAAVFSITPNGHLHMRYSARQRNVSWRDDADTQAAAQFLLDLWQQPSIYKLNYTLQAGEGLICNNVLHNRTQFTDSHEPQLKRLLYRGRYYQRVTEPEAVGA